MPTISWFYGISIRMFYNDHAPPHFHAMIGGYEAIVAIATEEVLKSELPVTARRLVRDGSIRYGQALMENWEGRAPVAACPCDAFPAWTNRMADLIKIRKIQRLGSYRLKVWFSDGIAGEWDFSGLTGEAGPMVEPFRRSACFDEVFIECGALTWPNGFDWSPEALYAEMRSVGALAFEGQPA